MSFSVLVKTAPGMLGSYTYELASREAAEVFVQRSDVWWWCFPVEEDTLDGGSWRKGGAWDFSEQNPVTPEHADILYEEQAGRIEADRVAFDFAREAIRPAAQEDNEDDDRW